MSVSVNIPEELYRRAAVIAAAQHRSVGEVFAAAFQDHLAALERVQKRAARGNREKFLAVLDQVPDTDTGSSDPV